MFPQKSEKSSAHTITHTLNVHTEKAEYLQQKWQMYSEKTHQTKNKAKLLRTSELKNNDPTSSLPKYENLMTYVAIAMGMLKTA